MHTLRRSSTFQLTHSRGVRLTAQCPCNGVQHNFNSRTHVECDRILCRAYSRTKKFQLTHSRGVRRAERKNVHRHCTISTHALTWSATFRRRIILMHREISTHALTWSATISPMNFVQNANISTHALTWSATIRPVSMAISSTISTHALTWSATSAISQYLGGTNNFNSRTHVECDDAFFDGTLDEFNFNSRTHVECDPPVVPACPMAAAFQLTHSRGVRQPLPVVPTTENNFNSRTHVECDPTSDQPQLKKDISTHALTWSATCS